MTHQIIYDKNDNILECNGLKNGIDSAFQNSSTVTVTLVDKNNVNVVGDTWPKTLAYVAASDGIYRATILDTLTLTANENYVAKVTANAGAGLLAYWETPVVVKTRK